MSATLPHGAVLPVLPPPVDPRLRRRPLPPELVALAQDQSPTGRAILRLAKDLYQPSPEIAEIEESFRHRLAEAINQTGQAAFTPRTYITRLPANIQIDASPWIDLTGLEQLIVSPVPARVTMILNMLIWVRGNTDDPVEFRIFDGSIARAEGSYVYPAALANQFQWSLTLQDQFDALPQTLYTLTPQGQVSAAGPNWYALAGTNSNFTTFTVRVEPRSLRE